MATNSAENSRSIPQNFLSRIPVSELKSIRVAVRRTNLTTSVSPGPIQRNIEDPKQLIPLVHIRKDEARRPKHIFDHEGIIVNQEERFSTNEIASSTTRQPHSSVTFTRSHSHSPRRRSRTRTRSRTPERDRRKVVSREHSREKNNDRDKKTADPRRSSERDRGRVPQREKEWSLERDTDKRSYKSRPHSRDQEDERYRRRSRTPLRPGEYRPPQSDVRRRSISRERDHPHDKYRTHSRRSRSRSADYHKPSTSRKLSRSPRRSITPPRNLDRQKSPRYESSKTRRSRSPPKSEKTHYSEKRGRDPSPGRRKSRSPSRYERDKRRSRSPRYVEGSRSRSSPGRYERYSSRRHSRSPGRYEGYRHSPDKRCRSPHPPIVTFSRSRSDHRRSSRSPGYDRDREYHKRRRSRSRSLRKHRSRSPREERETEFAFYEGIPGSEYWIPGPIRPGFPAIPRFYPPAFFPRMPGAPIIIPPRIPIVAPYPPYRQRLPIYNSKQKPKVSNPGPSASDGTVSTTAVGEEASGSASTVQTGEGNVTIQEMSDTDSHKSDKKNPEDESRDSLHEKD